MSDFFSLFSQLTRPIGPSAQDLSRERERERERNRKLSDPERHKTKERMKRLRQKAAKQKVTA